MRAHALCVKEERREVWWPLFTHKKIREQHHNALQKRVFRRWPSALAQARIALFRIRALVQVPGGEDTK